MCGFSLIRSISLLQHVSSFAESSAFIVMIPVFFNVFILIGLFRLADYLRHKFRTTPEDEAACDLWDEGSDDAENDVAQLALSFPTVVALRFAITGQLPNLEGLEEPFMNHSVLQMVILFGGGLLGICLAIGLISWRLREQAKKSAGELKASISYEAHGGLDPIDVYMHRWVFIFINVSATIFSWAAMFGTKWALHDYLVGHGLESKPNSCLQRIVLALIVSFASFVVIRFLDLLQDMDSTGHHADKVIH